MADANNRSLQQIKHETEQTRAHLTSTVEQLKTSVAETASDLRQRISPDAIKAEVSDYIRSRGEQLMDDVASAARRNPMQAVAVGASVAYPLLKLARAIPFPVLMMGAGLFFAGSKTGQAATQKASDIAGDLSEEMVRRAQDLSDQVQETASSAKDFASDQYDRMSSVITRGSSQATIASSFDKMKDLAGSAGTVLSDRADSIKDDGLRIVSSTAGSVQDFASAATAAARNAASLITNTAIDGAATMRVKASDASERAAKTVVHTIEQNPLLVAGVGLLVGGLIASALPRSDFEDELVGNTSSAAKRQVQAAASKAFDTAKTAAAEVYDELSRQAQAEGLTKEGVAKATQDITERLRHVAEAGVNTAFEPSEKNHQSKPRGDNDHG